MASHWYIRRGDKAFRYAQYNKDGSESKRILRGRALADGAAEGLTSILSRITDQGPLIPWAGRLGVMSGHEIGAAGGSIEDAKTLFQEQRDRAATEGSLIHDAIEQFLVSGAVPEDAILSTAAAAAANWLAGKGITEVSAEHCLFFKGRINDVAVKFGGTTDVISPLAVADWKSVEADQRGKYHIGKASHCAQLAGYRLAGSEMGLCSPDAMLYNVYFDRKTGRIVGEIQWTKAQARAGLEMIAHACRVQVLTERIEK